MSAAAALNYLMPPHPAHLRALEQAGCVGQVAMVDSHLPQYLDHHFRVFTSLRVCPPPPRTCARLSRLAASARLPWLTADN